MDFANRHVVVTGGTGALGAAVLTALLDAGATCVVPHRDQASLSRFPHRDHERVTYVAAGDLADESAVMRFYDGLPGLWASIHLVGSYTSAPIARSDRSVLMSQLETNLVSAYLCSRAAALTLRRLATGGRIVNVAARQALEPRLGNGSVAYTISKAGVAALTVALGAELAAEGILVNAVAPSIIDSPANRAAMPDARVDAWPKAEEVAATVLFLASPQNSVTRGAVIPVYGGS